MKFFRHETSENSITLYPLVCWHVGAKQSDEGFIKETIKRIKDDPRGRWIYLGDGGECVTKTSKGDLFSQTMSLQEQQDRLVDLLKPIQKKGLFGVRGNHGHRVFKETGLEFDSTLCTALQVPYMGVSCFMRLVVKKSTYDTFWHHGLDSGVATGTKINAAKKLEAIVQADAIFSAHSHVCVEIPPKHTAYIASSHTDNGDAAIKWRTTNEYICGCAYDSRSGYAEDKGYPPIIPAHLSVEFGGKIIEGLQQRKQTCTIWRAEA